VTQVTLMLDIVVQFIFDHISFKPMTDASSSLSKKLVRETRTRNLDGIEL